mgnify:CR=1 FL=1
MDFLSTFSTAASGMKAQTRRLQAISQNMANADTPGFKRKDLTFEEALDGKGVSVAGMTLDRTEAPKIFDPNNPLADADGYYEGSNVSMVLEVADAREASRSYEANLQMFDQARRMSSALLDLIRR